jgi:uncharacterized protein (DUF697 family)
MTRKPLPKAITRSSIDLRAIAGGVVTDEEAPAPQSALPHDAVEPEAAVFSGPVANDRVPAASARARQFAAKRRSIARKIVERHKMYAAMGGLFPLPIVNIAGVTAINVRMVKQLSELYAVPFQRDRARATIIGLIGGAVPTGVGAAAASTLIFIAPGAGLVGLGVSAITAGALTRGIGLVFIESFESTAMPLGGAAPQSA